MAYFFIDNPTRVNKRFAEAFRIFCIREKLNSEDAANLMHTSRGSIRNWINNRTAMSSKSFDYVVEALGLPESYFFMEDDEAAKAILSERFSRTQETVEEAVQSTDEILNDATSEATPSCAWVGEFQSVEDYLAFVGLKAPTLVQLSSDEEMQRYITFCLGRGIPMTIRPAWKEE